MIQAFLKINLRSHEGIYLFYSTKSIAYQHYNQRLKKFVESTNYKVGKIFQKQDRLCSNDLDDDENNQLQIIEDQVQNQNTIQEGLVKEIHNGNKID